MLLRFLGSSCYHLFLTLPDDNSIAEAKNHNTPPPHTHTVVLSQYSIVVLQFLDNSHHCALLYHRGPVACIKHEGGEHTESRWTKSILTRFLIVLHITILTSASFTVILLWYQYIIVCRKPLLSGRWRESLCVSVCVWGGRILGDVIFFSFKLLHRKSGLTRYSHTYRAWLHLNVYYGSKSAL